MSPDYLERPWYREPWPWILMAGPAAVIVAGAATLWVAVATSDGLVADDYYRKGLGINKVIGREEAARRMGLEARVERDGRRLRVHLAGDAPEVLFAHLAHATRAGNDARLRLTRGADGAYEAALPDLAPGKWRIALEDARGRWRIAQEAL